LFFFCNKAFGLDIQKKAHQTNEQLPQQKQKSPVSETKDGDGKQTGRKKR
jgi:hypothetical protein